MLVLVAVKIRPPSCQVAVPRKLLVALTGNEITAPSGGANRGNWHTAFTSSPTADQSEFRSIGCAIEDTDLINTTGKSGRSTKAPHWY